MRELYKQIEDRLEKVKFEELFKDFKRYDFALYNDLYVYLSDKTIPYDNRFIGNTAIYYENNYLAIWRIDGDISIDRLASKLIHEMFHAFQMDKSDSRFPNEFKALEYRYVIDNVKLKYIETKHLIDAFIKNDANEYAIFHSLRKNRNDFFKEEVEYEQKVETIEGMARFVEIMSLKHLNPSLYAIEIDEMLKKLGNKRSYHPIRVISYEIGALIMLYAKQTHIDIGHDLSSETRPIKDMIQANYIKNIEIENEEFDIDFITSFYKDLDKAISKLIRESNSNHEFDFIIGFDPLNTHYYNGYLYCKHFILFSKDSKNQFIKSECVVDMKEKRIIEKKMPDN